MMAELEKSSTASDVSEDAASSTSPTRDPETPSNHSVSTESEDTEETSTEETSSSTSASDRRLSSESSGRGRSHSSTDLGDDIQDDLDTFRARSEVEPPDSDTIQSENGSEEDNIEENETSTELVEDEDRASTKSREVDDFSGSHDEVHDSKDDIVDSSAEASNEEQSGNKEPVAVADGASEIVGQSLTSSGEETRSSGDEFHEKQEEVLKEDAIQIPDAELLPSSDVKKDRPRKMKGSKTASRSYLKERQNLPAEVPNAPAIETPSKHSSINDGLSPDSGTTSEGGESSPSASGGSASDSAASPPAATPPKPKWRPPPGAMPMMGFELEVASRQEMSVFSVIPERQVGDEENSDPVGLLSSKLRGRNENFPDENGSLLHKYNHTKSPGRKSKNPVSSDPRLNGDQNVQNARDITADSPKSPQSVQDQHPGSPEDLSDVLAVPRTSNHTVLDPDVATSPQRAIERGVNESQPVKSDEPLKVSGRQSSAEVVEISLTSNKRAAGGPPHILDFDRSCCALL